MKKFNIAEIRSWDPCYDPSRYLPENWKGCALDILEHSCIPFKDKLWVIFRDELVSDKLMRLFAIFAYRQTLNWIKNPNPRSIEAVNVAERYANRNASDYELFEARSAAWSAELGARVAANAADDETFEEARLVARSAEVAAYIAEDYFSAGLARWAAEWWTEIKAPGFQFEIFKVLQYKLKEMLLAGVETGDTK